jgi:hypothetical protein
MPERFATAKSFLSTAPEFQKELRGNLKIPSFFFDRMYLQSSGFCGHDVWVDKDEEVEVYSMYSNAAKAQDTVRISLTRTQRTGPASRSSRRTTSSKRRGRSRHTLPTITTASASGTPTLRYMGRRARGTGGNGTRWASSHAGRSRGRSRCCVSICRRNRNRTSSLWSGRRTSHIPVLTPCSRSSRMLCFGCMMTRSGRSETISASGKP